MPRCSIERIMAKTTKLAARSSVFGPLMVSNLPFFVEIDMPTGVTTLPRSHRYRALDRWRPAIEVMDSSGGLSLLLVVEDWGTIWDEETQVRHHLNKLIRTGADTPEPSGMKKPKPAITGASPHDRRIGPGCSSSVISSKWMPRFWNKRENRVSTIRIPNSRRPPCRN
jgi:hypothetical protein